MNERILELARQVWPDPSISHTNHLKFAELIIRECMSCCDVVEKIEWPAPTTYEFGVEVCKVKIQTHFGVK